MWILESVLDDPMTRPEYLLDGNIFHGYDDVLAWSDNLLLLAPVYGAASWISGGNPVFAFNVTSFVGYLLGAIAVYGFARWLLRSPLGGFLAALLFTATPYRSVLVGHTQLVGIMAVPLGLWFLFRFLRSRRLLDAAVVGLSVVVGWYSAVYFALLLALFLPVAALAWVSQALLRPRRALDPRVDRSLVVGGVAAISVAGVLIAPTLGPYLRLQELGFFDRAEGTVLRAQWRYLAELPRSLLYGSMFDTPGVVGDRGGFYPGLLVIIGLVAAVTALVLRRTEGREATERGTRAPRDRHATPMTEFLIPLVSVAAVAFLLSFGPVDGAWGGLFRSLRAHVPGFRSLRDSGRLWLVVMVVLAVVAAHGLLVLVRSAGVTPSPRSALVVGAAVLCVVLVESSIRPGFASIVRDDRAQAVYRALDELPPGVVTEAPPPAAAAGSGIAVVQTSRQLLSLIDGNTRLEGYSGAFPPALRRSQVAVSHLPKPAAIEHLRSRGVRYVVLHVGLRDDPDPCAHAYAVDEATVLRSALEVVPGVVEIHSVDGSEDIVVELAPHAGPTVEFGSVLTPFGERSGMCRAAA